MTFSVFLELCKRILLPCFCTDCYPCAYHGFFFGCFSVLNVCLSCTRVLFATLYSMCVFSQCCETWLFHGCGGCVPFPPVETLCTAKLFIWGSSECKSTGVEMTTTVSSVWLPTRRPPSLVGHDGSGHTWVGMTRALKASKCSPLTFSCCFGLLKVSSLR